MCALLAVSVAGLIVKSQLARPDSRTTQAETPHRDARSAGTRAPDRPAPPSAGQPLVALQARPQESTQSVSTTPSRQQPDAPAITHEATVGPARQSENSSAALRAAPANPPSSRSHPPANFESPGGAQLSIPASTSLSSSAPSAAGPVTLELDPGVPVPAALLPAAEENRSPTVAAAQEQIADSFVREVDEALSQPETPAGNAAVNDAYYDALTRANELYRALHGDEAYNKKTMQATLEAQTGK